MKFFLIAALVAVAVAEPEADSDAQLYRTAGVYPTLYNRGIYGAVSPFYNTAGVYNTGVYGRRTYSTLNPFFNTYRALGKREAESDADSDAQLYRTAGFYPSVYGSNLYNHGVYATPSVYSTYNTAAVPGVFQNINKDVFGRSYSAFNPIYNQYRALGKREAESDPEADPLLYRTAGFYPSTYGSVYNHGVYGTPSIYGSAYATPSIYNRYSAFNPVYNNFGLRALGKRDADSDPATVYTNGQFHTNAANLAKGIHTQYAGPVGSLYNSYKTPIAATPFSYGAYSPYTAYSGFNGFTGYNGYSAFPYHY